MAKCFTIGTALACLLAASVVEAASPRLDHLQPQGGQRGTEVAVTLIGGRIGQEPQQILFYDPGIELKSIERIDDNQAKATPIASLAFTAFAFARRRGSPISARSTSERSPNRTSKNPTATSPPRKRCRSAR